MGGDETSAGETSQSKSAKGRAIIGKKKPNRTAKGLLLGVVGLLVAFTILSAYVTHGFLWSVYTPIYDRLLHSIPTPPGLLAETERINLNPELPWGYQQYEVEENHEQTVRFFLTELPRAGWDLLQRGGMSIGIETEPGGYLEYDEILLSKREKYWLILTVSTRTNVGGAGTGETWVRIEIHREERTALSRY